MRGWTISIYLLSPEGEDLPASCFEKATYILHDSFGPKRMRQTIRRPPFTIHEKGWGEFDMQIQLTPIGTAKSGEQTLAHDLNFQQDRYESTHNVTFRNPKGPLLDALRESGDVGEPALKANGVTSTPGQAKEKKVRKNQNRNVDMEKLAEALPQLGEEDLLQVVQMVHDNKTEDTYTKNDVDSESITIRIKRWKCTNNLSRRRRVPRRPLHPPGPADQDALGLHVQPCQHERAGIEGLLDNGLFGSSSSGQRESKHTQESANLRIMLLGIEVNNQKQRDSPSSQAEISKAEIRGRHRARG